MTEQNVKSTTLATPEYMLTTIAELAQKHGIQLESVHVDSKEVTIRVYLKPFAKPSEYMARMPLTAAVFYRHLDNTFTAHAKEMEV